MTFNHILVPVDFSPWSDQAVDYAFFLGERSGARITLLHAVVLFAEDVEEGERLKAYETLLKQKEQSKAAQLETHRARGAERGVKIDSVLRRGVSAADTLLDHLSEHRFDLVVMATHGGGGVRNWVFGSVAQKVVAHSPRPVLTIHREWSKRDIKTVLVPVDLSEFSKRAVREGEALARQFKARLVFLHTIHQEEHPAEYHASLSSASDVGPQLRPRVKESLIEFTGIPEERASYEVTVGRAHVAVPDYVDQHDVDLIVMATRGQGALERLLLGSTAERIVRLARCPVITVR